MVKLNPDAAVVKTVREGLKRTGGYCPCRLERTEENKCMCREFRAQIADPDFEGFCHCMLYYKSKDDKDKQCKDKDTQKKSSGMKSRGD